MEERKTVAPETDRTAEDWAFCPSQYDAAVIETWLEDRAREGWQLKRFTNWGGKFEKAAPRPTRYRLTPMTRKEKAPDPERLELCAAQGWQYAATRYELFHVWRTDDALAPEMDTDPVTQAEGYRWVRRRLIGGLAAASLLCAVLIAFLAYAYFRPGGYLLNMAEGDAPMEGLLRLIVGPLVLIVLGLQLRGMDRTLRHLRTGIPLERPAPYRTRQRVTAVLTAVGVLAYFYLILFSCLVDDFRDIRGDEAALARTTYVDMTVLDPAAEGAELWKAETKRLELIPRMDRVGQLTVDAAGSVTGSVETAYYRLLTAGLAEELERELVSRYAERANFPGNETRISMESVPAGDLDAFYLKDWPEEHRQSAVVRLGRSVLYVIYNGPGDLREHTDYLAALLS